VKGTATAASLWVTGAVGTAVGLGIYDVAVILAIVTFLTLKVLTPLKREPPERNFIGNDPND
jgi:putative Mg2+ transporter-C (MgtC) family protein